MSADFQMFNKHLGEANFQLAVDKGLWGVVDEDPQHPSWPVVIIWIAAKPKKSCPDKYYFRFNVAGYPNQAPTACPWDISKNQKLEHSLWPQGPKLVSLVFKPSWDHGNSLYAPCDRVAISGHPNWANDHPDLWWTSSSKITVYLNFLHGLLNSSDYENS